MVGVMASACGTSAFSRRFVARLADTIPIIRGEMARREPNHFAGRQMPRPQGSAVATFAIPVVVGWRRSCNRRVAVPGWVTVGLGRIGSGTRRLAGASAANLPEGAPILNQLNYGGFVIYFVPRLRVYIDDRCELYRDEGLIAYDRLLPDAKRVDDEVRRFNIRVALVAADLPGNPAPLDRILKRSTEWREVKRGAAAVVYVRD